MAVQDYFESPVAYNPDADQLVAGASFQVYAGTDEALTTPLTPLDAVSGTPIGNLRSSSIGVLPAFRVAGDPAQVILKSGTFTTRVTSKYGIFLDVVPDPDLLTQAVASAGLAEAAKVAAEDAAAAAQAVGNTNDGIIAGRINDPVSASRQAIVTVATDIRPTAGRSILSLGDSHTAGVGTTVGTRSFPRQQRHAAGTFYAAAAGTVTAGYPGETTAELLARLPGLLDANPLVDIVVFEGGANDVNQAVPIATTMANYRSVVALCHQRGKKVIIVGVPPKVDIVSVTDAVCRHIEALNVLLAVECPRMGVKFADIHPVLTDPATGRTYAHLTDVPTDHMNNLAHLHIANIIGPLIRASYDQQNVPVKQQRKANLCTNGFFLSGTAPLPTGWSALPDAVGSPSSTITLETDTTGYLPGGKWLSFQANSTIAAVRGERFSIGSVTSGDELAFTGYILIEDISGDWVANCIAGTAAAAIHITRNSGLASAAITPSIDGYSGIPIGGGKYLIGPMYGRGTATATETHYVRLSMIQPAGSHYKVSWGAIEALNLTTLGLAASLR